MKKLLLLCTLLVALPVCAQSVKLHWNPPQTGSGYSFNVYRVALGGSGVCAPFGSAWTKVVSNISQTNYRDTSAPGGATYCYAVTTTNSSGSESVPSNLGAASVASSFIELPPPTQLSASTEGTM
jgi:hypothetical protein